MLSLDRSIEEAKVSQETRVGRLILVPALITLGVTLLRLVGECVFRSIVITDSGRR